MAPTQSSAVPPGLIAAIDRETLKRNGIVKNGEVSFTCTNNQAHDHGDRRPSCRWNREKAVFICDVCQLQGGAFALAKLFGLPLDDGHNGHRPPTRWVIRNLKGEPQAVHVRIDTPDGKKIWFEQPDGKKGLDGRSKSSLPLYGSERLASLPDGSQVVVTEGEKAADALHAIGIAAVGTVTGAASAPAPEVLESLRGFSPCLWPDNDDPGRKHMGEMISSSLATLGIPHCVIDWPTAPPKGDAADFVSGGGNADGIRGLIAKAHPRGQPDTPVEAGDLDSRFEITWRATGLKIAFSRVEVSRGNVYAWLTAEAGSRRYGPVKASLTSATGIATLVKQLTETDPTRAWRDHLSEATRLLLWRIEQGEEAVDLADVEPEPEIDLISPTVPMGKVAMISADVESTKSYLMLAHAISAASGKVVVPGIIPNEPARVLILDWEDSQNSYAGRLRAICRGADIDPDSLRGWISYVRCDKPLVMMAEWVRRTVREKRIELVLIDALGGALGGELIDPAVAMPFFNALRGLRCSILIAHHENRNGDKSKGYGGIYLAAAPRRRFSLQKSQEIGEHEVNIALSVQGANDSYKFEPLAWRVEFDQNRPAEWVRWKRIKAADTPGIDQTASARARIRSLLSDGQPRTSEAIADALSGSNPRTVQNTLSKWPEFGHVDGRGSEWVLISGASQ